MPKNRVMYIGVLLIAASVLLWLGGLLINKIHTYLPYAGGVGVALLIIGLFMEIHKARTPVQPRSTSSETETSQSETQAEGTKSESVQVESK